MSGYDSCGQRKVEIDLMCLFDEKVSELKKMCDGGPKSALKYCPVILNRAKTHVVQEL